MSAARGTMQLVDAATGNIERSACCAWHGGACSFCGRGKSATVTLVEGPARGDAPRPAICIECLRLGRAMLAAGAGPAPEPTAPKATP